MEKGFKKTICDLLGITPRSYSNYKKEGKPIIAFFEKGYLSKEDILQFLDSSKIDKLERANWLNDLENITKLSLRETLKYKLSSYVFISKIFT